MGIMHKSVYGALVYYFILNVGAYEIEKLANVSSCPFGSKRWQQRELQKSCDEDRGLLYHCMKSTWDTFLEFCMAPVSIRVKGNPPAFTSDGCPQIHDGDNVHIKYVMCSIGGRCPSKDNATFLSYEVYKYDGCYKEEMKATQISIERISATKHISTCSTAIAPYTAVNYSTSNDIGTEEATDVTALSILVVSLLVSMTTLTYRIVKTRKGTNDLYLQSTNCNATIDVNRQEERVYNEIETI